MDHAYSAGTLSGVDGRLSTVYYRLFLGQDGKSMHRPVNFDHPGLRLMGQLKDCSSRSSTIWAGH